MEMNEVMMTLVEDLRTIRGVAETTAHAYVKTLFLLNGKKPFKTLAFLKKTEDIVKGLSEYADTTQKAILATIVSVLSLKPSTKKLMEVYREKLEGKTKEVVENAPKDGEKSAKQSENWMTWEEVMAKKNDLAKAVKESASKKVLGVGEFDQLLSLVVLSLYTDIPPRRNQDFLELAIVKKWTEAMPKEVNYLDVAKKRFIFNKFKTAKTYGQQVVDIPESLFETLATYIKRHPLAKGKWTQVKLLVSHDGTPLTAVNSITRILNKIFGKKVGSSMLRHIFITDKYGGAKMEMKSDAKAMAHSVAEQQNVYNVPGGAESHVSIPTI